MEKKYLNEKEIAAILGIPSGTIRTWRNRNRGPVYVKADGKKGRVVYPIEEFERWLSDHHVANTSGDL